jgi:hypothetical protein
LGFKYAIGLFDRGQCGTSCIRYGSSASFASGKFKRNDVMEALMRTYIPAIAAAALFAIPAAAFSESIHVGPGGVKIGPSYGHHRLYNRYEGLYDRYESGRCKELLAVCTHKELREQGMGNCRRFRELCD